MSSLFNDRSCVCWTGHRIPSAGVSFRIYADLEGIRDFPVNDSMIGFAAHGLEPQRSHSGHDPSRRRREARPFSDELQSMIKGLFLTMPHFHSEK